MINKILRRLRWIAYRLRIRAAWAIWDVLRLLQGAIAVERVRDQEATVVLPSLPFHGRSAPQYARLLKVRSPEPWVEKTEGFPMAGRVPIVNGLAADGEATARNFSTAQFFSGFPRLGEYVSRAGPTVHLGKAALSLRHPYEFNFYHATVDVLGGLALADAAGLPGDAPLLIGPALARQPFFKSWQQMGPLSKRTWIVQETHVTADEIWVPQVWQPNKELLLKIPPLLGIAPPTQKSQRKLFITRSLHRGRALTNNQEIEDALKSYHFEPVDLDQVGVPQQIQLFQEAESVVAIHGAGLTNLLFRCGAPTNVIEIFPPHDADASFFLLCKELGYTWLPLVGHSPTSSSRQANFSLDVTHLKRALEAGQRSG